MKKVKICEIADVVSGISAPKLFIDKNEKNAVPFIRAGSLEKLCAGKDEIIEYLDSTKYKTIPKDTVVFAKSGMSTMKNRIYTTKNEAVIVGHLVGIVCKEKVYSKYIEYFFKYNKPSKLIKNDSYPSITIEDIKKIEIVLPEKNEQIKIVRILSLLEETINIKTNQVDKLDKLAKAQFIELFEKNNYEKIKIGNEFNISSGGTPSKEKEEYWNSPDVSWIGSNLCQNIILYENDGKYISLQGLKHSSAKVYPINTILVALVGATIGKTALLKFETATNQNIAGIQISDRFNAEYVFYAIQSLYYKFIELGNGGFKMANLSFVRSLEIPMPPIEIQNKFAEFVMKINQQVTNCDKTINKLLRLKETKMEEYFGGVINE